jgi:hypothetical protein
MNNKSFSPENSLKTIEAAINEAKTSKTGASFYYILWGLILLINYSLHYLIIVKPILKGTFIDIFSWVLFPIGGLLSMLNKKNDQMKETNVPNLEKVYFFAFTSFAMVYGILSIASTYLSYSFSIMLFPLIIGSTVYIVGGISKHKPSIIGGVFSMLISILSILSIIEIQYLIAAFSCITACIIPGITMKKSNV